MDRYADFGTSVWTGGQIISFTTNAIPVSGPELLRNSMLGSDCGNVICYSIGAYTVGTCSPRVRHVHPVRRSLKQPSASGRSCATPLLPGVRYWSRFSRSRLWNFAVFMVFVQDEQYLETGREHLPRLMGVRNRCFRCRPACRW